MLTVLPEFAWAETKPHAMEVDGGFQVGLMPQREGHLLDDPHCRLEPVADGIGDTAVKLACFIHDRSE